MTNPTFLHETHWEAAYDRSSESYGIHGVNMTWIVHGPVGSVSWTVFTGWHLPHIEHIEGHPSLNGPTPSDLGYHADTPQHEGQTSMKCGHRPSKICYYDGSSINAAWPMKTLVTEGGDATWKKLEAYYRCTLEDGPWPWEDDEDTWQTVQRFSRLGSGEKETS